MRCEGYREGKRTADTLLAAMFSILLFTLCSPFLSSCCSRPAYISQQVLRVQSHIPRRAKDGSLLSPHLTFLSDLPSHALSCQQYRSPESKTCEDRRGAKVPAQRLGRQPGGPVGRIGWVFQNSGHCPSTAAVLICAENMPHCWQTQPSLKSGRKMNLYFSFPYTIENSGIWKPILTW